MAKVMHTYLNQTEPLLPTAQTMEEPRDTILANQPHYTSTRHQKEKVGELSINQSIKLKDTGNCWLCLSWC